uniref:Olfactory receptor 66 n=1 Tax=Aulacocentrum confusum TaxID=2767324 RepID=A0A7G8Z985_9HYME|nr:olfactory receptor 66 [Aulacocentrum confusum]
MIKVVNSTVQLKKIKKLLYLIQEEWDTIQEGPVLDIMTETADRGGKLSIYYALFYFNTLIIFMLLPLRPNIMVWLGFNEGPVDFVFPYHVDYFIDSDKYFYAIEFHIISCSTVVVTVLVAVDTLLIIFVQHACSLFSSISYRLEHLIDEKNLYWYPVKTEDPMFAVISDCIKKHNQAIEFTKLIGATYSWSLFFGIGLNILLMSVSGIQVINLFGDLDEMLRYVPFVVGEMSHIFIETLISQQLMDYSLEINKSICMVNWYNLSMKSQKLLSMMFMRSRIACTITAGNFFTMSLELFMTIMKTSASYFTLLRSVQESID